MKFSRSSVVTAIAFIASNNNSLNVAGFSFNSQIISPSLSTTTLPSSAVDDNYVSSTDDTLDYQAVNKLAFRELQKQCKERDLPATGATGILRNRLLESLGLISCETENNESDECVPVSDPGFTYVDESDPEYDFQALISEIDEKVEEGHWKVATRRLKKLKKRYVTSERKIPPGTYTSVLELCLANKLHGARASEPARKILEEMSSLGYFIPPAMGNQCVLNSLGNGPNGSHDGCGGIDTALAMLAAMESSPRGFEMINVDTYGTVVSALSKNGEIDEALILLRAMVVEHSFTPSLSTFADVAKAAAKAGEQAEKVLQVMTLAKASGYILDSVASAEAGRDLLASGVIAAEQMDNLALGLRFLTAASKAEGCAPDRGDDLVASSSSAAQRASTLIHKRAIDKAIQDNNWKLAVKLEMLMKERSLNIATSVLRKVVSICAKNEKSKRAASIIFDWVERYEEGIADMPPINVFNTVVNACEICGEEDLTLQVLEAMRKIHGTSGNIVTTNIALKRLAKLGNTMACEGLIIGLLQEGVEPTVVSYTTAIGACVQANDSAMAYEWIKRMRSRNVMPNFHTYNTALAACLDGKFESTVRGSTIAAEMLADTEKELANGLSGNAEYNSVTPDSYSKVLARNLMKKLRENWRAGDINMAVAKSTLRVPLLKLVDFEKTDAAAAALKLKTEREAARRKLEAVLNDDAEECGIDVENCEDEVDMKATIELIKRRMEV